MSDLVRGVGEGVVGVGDFGYFCGKMVFMKFRTEIAARRGEVTLDPQRPVVMLGSCFADNVVGRMRASLWDACNPVGTLYNPLSIERVVRLLLFIEWPERDFDETLFRNGRLNSSWLFDSKSSCEFMQDSLSRFQWMRETLTGKLAKAQALFVTFGTSWCYFLADRPDFVVANCHKQPSSMFLRRRISIGEIADAWEGLGRELREHYPELRIVFTVSPVRHLKDGFEGNARSKAVLQLAVEEICRRLDFCDYFPAYELMNDDLRDYRFYASDLVHPSEEAVDYIWEFFKATYLDEAGIEILKRGEKIMKGWLHKPLQQRSGSVSEATMEQERKRREKLLEESREFAKSYPGMLIMEEMAGIVS